MNKKMNSSNPPFGDVSSDFPEILRSRNRDLKITYNNFRGYHLTRLLLFFFFVNLARNSRKFNISFLRGKRMFRGPPNP